MNKAELKNQIESQFRLKVRHQYDERLKNRTTAIEQRKEVKDLKALVDGIQEQLKPVTKFFNNIQKQPALSKMTRAEKEVLENEEREKRLTALALAKMARKKR